MNSIVAFVLFAVLALSAASVIVAPETKILETPITRTSIVGPSGSITQEESLPIVETPVVHHEAPLVVAGKSAIVETVPEPVVLQKSLIVENTPIVHHESPLVLEKSAYVETLPVAPTLPAFRYEHPVVVGHHHGLVHPTSTGFFYRSPEYHYSVPLAYRSFY